MPTVSVNLDTTQYVQVNTGLNPMLLQAHRDTVRVTLSEAKPTKGNTVFHIIGREDPILKFDSIDTNVWALATTDKSSLIASETVPISVIQPASSIRDFFFEVSAGNVPGHTPHHRTGHNNAITTDLVTVWPVAAIYTFSTTANIQEVSSSSASDNGLVLSVEGLNDAWEQVAFDVALDATDGRTTVDWVTSGEGVALRALCGMRVNDTSAAIGDVYSYINGATVVAGVPTVLSEIRSKLENGNGRALQALCTVPANKTGYIVLGATSCSSGKDVEISFMTHKWNGTSYNSPNEEHHVEMYEQAYQYGDRLPFKLEEKTAFDVRAVSSASGTKASASFDLILVDN